MSKLTNAHVIGGANGGEVVFADGVDVRFDVIGVDPLSDLAVLRTRSGAPGAASLGDADLLVVGELVVAVGARSGWSACPRRCPRPLPPGPAETLGCASWK
ncbi:S1C family serine protease [Nocardia sp. NBC_01730]|uniref:S1C family serine protease n=1 Tax=Nocardia sp. NBC_01730 TaxID=2975998 RepID=UPI002E10C315|nr:S1C family serine protease [Nocardia sp. NBC_01730]